MVLDGLIVYNFTSHVHIGETIDNENFSGLRGHEVLLAAHFLLVQVFFFSKLLTTHGVSRLFYAG